MKQEIKAIATIKSGFSEKFGIPRQSGLVSGTRATIVFEPEYRDAKAFQGIEEYSHLWLIWGFSMVKQDKFSATVAPPRLGGKIRKGVFATRSPFRPNKLGLSSVKLEEVVCDDKLGTILVVSGADLLDGTPIYDVKPYLEYTDSHPGARGSFGQAHMEDGIQVEFSQKYVEMLGEELYQTIYDLLGQDPRAAYNKAPDYVYGMAYEGYDIRFVVQENRLKVCDVIDTSVTSWKKVK